MEGVGMVIQPDETQQLVVRSLSENGDAAASGLVQPGDIVYSINGQIVWRSSSSVISILKFSIFGKNLLQKMAFSSCQVVRDLIVGPAGTEVTIGLLRAP